MNKNVHVLFLAHGLPPAQTMTFILLLAPSNSRLLKQKESSSPLQQQPPSPNPFFLLVKLAICYVIQTEMYFFSLYVYIHLYNILWYAQMEDSHADELHLEALQLLSLKLDHG